MDENAREDLFEQAVSDYRRGSFGAARKALARLVEDGSRDPSHISFYGLLLALTGERERSIDLCEDAVRKDGRRTSALYVNLARALSASGRRSDAISALNRGLLVHPSDRRLKRALQQLVPRAQPPFPSLSRKHPVNRCLGLARTLGGRVWVALSGLHLRV
jgi:predicted Zn-dependent protease